MNRDLQNNIEEVICVVPVAGLAATGTYNGAAIDTQGYDSGTINLALGADVGGAATLTIQESDAAGSGYADAAAADVIGTQGVSGVGSDVVSLGYIGSKRYIRAVVEVTADVVISSVAILGDASQAAV